VSPSELAQFSDRVRPLRRVEYDRLVETGLLENEKVELIRGLMVHMSPQGVAHAAVIQRLSEMLMLALLPTRLASVRVQLPLALADDSEPEPDLAVVPPGSYRDQHPTHALIVVEVAETSIAYDRREKGALYADGGVPEYWIVDTVHQRVEVHTDPVGGAYTRVTPHRRGEVITSTTLPQLQITVDDMFA
jgi:Uma2 family endonuclease